MSPRRTTHDFGTVDSHEPIKSTHMIRRPFDFAARSRQKSDPDHQRQRKNKMYVTSAGFIAFRVWHVPPAGRPDLKRRLCYVKSCFIGKGILIPIQVPLEETEGIVVGCYYKTYSRFFNC